MKAQEQEIAARLEAMKLYVLAEQNDDSANSDCLDSTDRQTLTSREVPVRRLGSLSEIVASVMELEPARGDHGFNHVVAEHILSQVRYVLVQSKSLSHAQESTNAVKLRKELEALKRRYDMVLVIIDEQNEKVYELEADMADVKALYHEQMNLLISQVYLDKWPNGYRICLFSPH
ncbi:hypothetical protein R1sor_019948 [Riccia sorocarpa]|uniref:TATA element modulatory factor 1 TATA binding domain-containing protein n=1 Tax=Riccia sorocarpa TaxID=122646 RepID=A0ABD3IF31_9MARC